MIQKLKRSIFTDVAVKSYQNLQIPKQQSTAEPMGFLQMYRCHLHFSFFFLSFLYWVSKGDWVSHSVRGSIQNKLRKKWGKFVATHCLFFLHLFHSELPLFSSKSDFMYNSTKFNILQYQSLTHQTEDIEKNSSVLQSLINPCVETLWWIYKWALANCSPLEHNYRAMEQGILGPSGKMALYTSCQGCD